MVSTEPRLSTDALKVLGAMLEDPMAWYYGLQLSRNAHISTGTIYPMLARLENAEWLESRWEEQGPKDEGRPRRRLYRLTGSGAQAAMEQIDEIARLARRIKQREAKVGPRDQRQLA